MDNGDTVIPLTVVAALLFDGTPLLAQPTHVGILSAVDAQAGDASVLWDNGVFDTHVPLASLLQIQLANPATVAAFSGRVVRRTVGNQSEEYIGVPVLIANALFVSQEDEADFAIVKSIGPGLFYWVSVTAELEVVPGR